VSTKALGRSWTRGCPVSPSELRRLTVNYWGMDGKVHRGQIILHSDVVVSASKVFSGLYQLRFPIQRMAPLADFKNDMAKAHALDVTFGVSCWRWSDQRWAPQSFGRIITLNPQQNPLKTSKGTVGPRNGRTYLDRKKVRPGMLVGGAPAKVIRDAGWGYAKIHQTTYGRLQGPLPKSAQPRVEKLTSSDLPYSYRSGCPVKPSGLRRVLLYHWGFDGQLTRGEVIVRSSSVKAVTRVFDKAYAKRFPIRRMQRVDVWRASDQRAMKADNTSAFNCRKVTGNPYRMSQHSYGNAIDVNTFENPYVTGSRVYPPGSRGFLKRSKYRTGMILRSGVVARAFSSERWPWGARWRHPDYQHFSSNGG
jgi:hypothetical protein